MYPRTAALLLVGLLVITAGCVEGLGDVGPESGDVDDGDGAGDGGDGSKSPASENGDSGPADGSDGDARDGSAVDRNGDGLVENRTAVLLAAGSYTAVWEMESSTDGAVVGVISYTSMVDYANERSSFTMLIESEDEVSNDMETYHANGETFARYGAGDDATYNVNDTPFAPDNTMFPVQSYVAGNDLEEFAAVGTETYDGVTVTRYERTEQPAWVAAQNPDEEFTWTEFTYVVLVDTDGLVRYESWGGEGVDGEGVTNSIQFSYSLTDVGSTVVEEPDWIATARAQAEA